MIADRLRLARLNMRIQTLEREALVMAMHLVTQDTATMPAETVRVLETWRSVAEAELGIEHEPAICVQCNGSGEGMYDGTRCAYCKGRGVEMERSAA